MNFLGCFHWREDIILLTVDFHFFSKVLLFCFSLKHSLHTLQSDKREGSEGSGDGVNPPLPKIPEEAASLLASKQKFSVYPLADGKPILEHSYRIGFQFAIPSGAISDSEVL